MADIEFVEGDFGDSYVITIKDADGNNADISSYTAATLLINSIDLTTNKTTAVCSISSPNVTWSMADGDTDYDGSYIAQIQLTGVSSSKQTKQMSVLALKKLG